MRRAWLVVIAGCSGPPLAAKVPHPNTAAVAGVAAATAAAITLADPDAASRRPEQQQDDKKRPVEVRNTVPAEVFDRLDNAGSAGAEVKR